MSFTFFFFFFFNDTATTEIYTLSLHDALPISLPRNLIFLTRSVYFPADEESISSAGRRELDRKSTRLNSSHLVISYAVFCLKKKKHISQYNNRTHFYHCYAHSDLANLLYNDLY